jgi:siderophore-iron reductase FhuF
VTPPVPPGPGLVAVRTDEVLSAVGRAGAGNPMLGIGTDTDGLSAHRLATATGGAQATAVAELVDAVAGWLDHPERRVAASLVVLGYAARLVGPTLAVLLGDRILLDARPAQVRYAYTAAAGFRLTLPAPTGWRGPPDAVHQAWLNTVIDDHLTPLIAAVRADTPIAPRLLWGNVASGITGTLRALADQRAAPLDLCHRTGDNLLDHGPLRGAGRLTIEHARLQFRRRSCCLYYRLPGGGYCGDCPITRPR